MSALKLKSKQLLLREPRIPNLAKRKSSTLWSVYQVSPRQAKRHLSWAPPAPVKLLCSIFSQIESLQLLTLGSRETYYSTMRSLWTKKVSRNTLPTLCKMMCFSQLLLWEKLWLSQQDLNSRLTKLNRIGWSTRSSLIWAWVTFLVVKSVTRSAKYSQVVSARGALLVLSLSQTHQLYFSMSQPQALILSKLWASACCFRSLHAQRVKLLWAQSTRHHLRHFSTSIASSSWQTVTSSTKVTLNNLWTTSNKSRDLFHSLPIQPTTSWSSFQSTTLNSKRTKRNWNTWTGTTTPWLKSKSRQRVAWFVCQHPRFTAPTLSSIKQIQKFSFSNWCTEVGLWPSVSLVSQELNWFKP